MLARSIRVQPALVLAIIGALAVTASADVYRETQVDIQGAGPGGTTLITATSSVLFGDFSYDYSLNYVPPGNPAAQFSTRSFQTSNIDEYAGTISASGGLVIRNQRSIFNLGHQVIAKANGYIFAHLDVPSPTWFDYSYDILTADVPNNGTLTSGSLVDASISGVFSDILSAATTPSAHHSGQDRVLLNPGLYTIHAGASASSSSRPSGVNNSEIVNTSAWSFNLAPVSFAGGGGNQRDPILPDRYIIVVTDVKWYFDNKPRRRWFDPATADRFDFEMDTPDTYFTSLVLPAGLGDADGYTILDENGLVLASGLAGGTTYTFAGAGVAKFSIADIDPLFDPDYLQPGATGVFPIFLDFSSEEATFSMTPVNALEADAVPEPSTIVLAALGLLGLGCVALRKKIRLA